MYIFNYSPSRSWYTLTFAWQSVLNKEYSVFKPLQKSHTTHHEKENVKGILIMKIAVESRTILVLKILYSLNLISRHDKKELK